MLMSGNGRLALQITFGIKCLVGLARHVFYTLLATVLISIIDRIMVARMPNNAAQVETGSLILFAGKNINVYVPIINRTVIWKEGFL